MLDRARLWLARLILPRGTSLVKRHDGTTGSLTFLQPTGTLADGVRPEIQAAYLAALDGMRADGFKIVDTGPTPDP